MFFQSKLGLRIAGLCVVAVVASAFGLTAAFYNHAFSNPLTVTLRTSRAGLILDAGNVVKMRGVDVGTVGAVNVQPDGSVAITLDLDRSQIGMIPANVLASIDASTIFGAKYVTLSAPTDPSAQAIAAGAVIDNRAVTPEVDTLFDRLDQVLTSVNVVNLNVTLTSLAGAIRGRGSEIADLASQADAYLAQLQPLLPRLRADLYQLAKAGKLGVRIAPAFLELLRNASVSATTVTSYEQQLDRLLVDVSLLGKTGTDLLGANSATLQSVLKQLAPTVSMVASYSPELYCFLAGLENTREIMAQVIGGAMPGLIGRVSIRGALTPYAFPGDLPKLPHGSGPVCPGLPMLSRSQIPYSGPGSTE
jgi:phospholipid/cholesterol/gamma-HCH transport system substrate-binding protein